MARGEDTGSWAGKMGRAHDDRTRQERIKERQRQVLLRELYYRQHTLMDIRFFPEAAREFANKIKEVI